MSDDQKFIIKENGWLNPTKPKSTPPCSRDKFNTKIVDKKFLTILDLIRQGKIKEAKKYAESTK